MARIDKVSKGEIYRKDRGWGYELWIENLPDYCGKVLHIDEGKSGSMHYHMNKLETMYLQSGQVRLDFIDASDGFRYSVDLSPGDSIRIPRGQAHQINAIEESKLHEFSTIHEEEDSHRIWKGD